MIYLLFALLGLVVAVVINVLADDLPRRVWPERPHCPNCDYQYGVWGWWGLGRLAFQWGECPRCGEKTRRRPVLVEVGTVILFALLPWLIPNPVNLAINTLFIAVLILIIVIDLEHRLILHVVTVPTTLVALGLAYFYEGNSVLSALVGAVIGFLVFYLLFWIGNLMYGAGALGFGDVMLSMTMGAMLGFNRIFFALMLGILIGGVFSLILIVVRRGMRNLYLPYGQYLAIAGIIMLIWGEWVYLWYVS